jgi:hypothetical protein
MYCRGIGIEFQTIKKCGNKKNPESIFSKKNLGIHNPGLFLLRERTEKNWSSRSLGIWWGEGEGGGGEDGGWGHGGGGGDKKKAA